MTAPPASHSLERDRTRMVERQIVARGVSDPRVLSAMRTVPREAFLDESQAEFAYHDTALPISSGQTISQPFIVAAMAEAAKLSPADKVLEVGAGSGYAAAVLGSLVGEVYTIERRADLADTARERLAAMGYDNVHVHVGDGTRGLRSQAPFDAILVAAGGPKPSSSLKNQLRIGGRLIAPVGGRSRQSLLRITRTGPDTFETEDLGSVTFVPLIGAEGWDADADENRPKPAAPRSAVDEIRAAAIPLPDPSNPEFGAELDAMAAEARIMLLGESSHGTSEFYRARAAITKRLIERHGYTIVAVEADWPDAAAIDRYVRHRPARPDAAPPFQRFPTWMWRNTDVAALIDWMRGHNEGRANEQQAGFFGLDMYNMQGSIGAVLGYLERIDPDAARAARERYGCLTPWQHEPSVYGRAVLTHGYRKCEEEVVRQCRDLLAHQLDYSGRDPNAFLDAVQNARLIASAERYYRIMYYGGSASWNLRDSHMFETLSHLLEAHGPQSKAVVWAHNSHIGDARQTDMGASREEHNIGQLCRERFGEKARLIGFGTHTGTVAAASDWDGEVEVMDIKPSLPGSFERLCHEAGGSRFMLDLREGVNADLRTALAQPRLERFIGVIYRPDTERLSHYSEASLSRQFDAWFWFDETEAVTPLGPQHACGGVPDTFPFGL